MLAKLKVWALLLSGLIGAILVAMVRRKDRQIDALGSRLATAGELAELKNAQARAKQQKESADETLRNYEALKAANPGLTDKLGLSRPKPPRN